MSFPSPTFPVGTRIAFDVMVTDSKRGRPRAGKYHGLGKRTHANGYVDIHTADRDALIAEYEAAKGAGQVTITPVGGSPVSVTFDSKLTFRRVAPDTWRVGPVVFSEEPG